MELKLCCGRAALRLSVEAGEGDFDCDFDVVETFFCGACFELFSGTAVLVENVPGVEFLQSDLLLFSSAERLLSTKDCIALI